MRVLEHNSFLRKKRMFFALLFALHPMVAMGIDHVLNVGGTTLALSDICDSEHKLNVLYNGTTYCAPATTDTLTDTLHVLYNGITYSICNGPCGGDIPEYVMPATPPAPVSVSESCTWVPSDTNAYIATNGAQYFDTGTPVSNDKEISITAQITNGASVRLYGTIGSSCRYDLTVDVYGELQFRIGTSNYGTSVDGSNMESKNTWITRNHNSGPKKKNIYQNTENKKLTQMSSYECSTNNNIFILNNDWASVSNTNTGVKLYSFKIWNVNDTLLRDVYPVKRGTNICGYIVPIDCLYDVVNKQVLLPGGSDSSSYGYGSDS